MGSAGRVRRSSQDQLRAVHQCDRRGHYAWFWRDQHRATELVLGWAGELGDQDPPSGTRHQPWCRADQADEGSTGLASGNLVASQEPAGEHLREHRAAEGMDDRQGVGHRPCWCWELVLAEQKACQVEDGAVWLDWGVVGRLVAAASASAVAEAMV